MLEMELILNILQLFFFLSIYRGVTGNNVYSKKVSSQDHYLFSLKDLDLALMVLKQMQA